MSPHVAWSLIFILWEGHIKRPQTVHAWGLAKTIEHSCCCLDQDQKPPAQMDWRNEHRFWVQKYSLIPCSVCGRVGGYALDILPSSFVPHRKSWIQVYCLLFIFLSYLSKIFFTMYYFSTVHEKQRKCVLEGQEWNKNRI